MLHSRRPTVVLAVGLVAGLVALALTYGFELRPSSVVADVGDGHTRSYHKDTFSLPDGHERPWRFTINLVGGIAMTVCSQDFPASTKKAINRWNDRLGHMVMKFEDDKKKCSTAVKKWAPKAGVVRVFVTVGVELGNRYHGSILGSGVKCTEKSIACVRQDGSDATFKTRFGRLEVTLNPGHFCRDEGVVPTASCDAETQPSDDDTNDRLRYLIAHELGHALSLADYFCEHRDPANSDDATNRHPDFIDVPTLMNSFSFSPVDLQRTCNSPDGYPTLRDVTDYRTIYLPGAVTNVEGRTNEHTAILTWDQSDVFVESHFVIQRFDGAGWVEIGRAPANAESATLSSQPGGKRRYRIVAATKALPRVPGPSQDAHGPASDEVEL